MTSALFCIPKISCVNHKNTLQRSLKDMANGFHYNFNRDGIREFGGKNTLFPQSGGEKGYTVTLGHEKPKL